MTDRDLNFRLATRLKPLLRTLVLMCFSSLILLSQSAKPTRKPKTSPEANNPQTLAQKAIQSTAYIKIFDSSKIPISTGSGFLLNDKFVVTNYHVIEGGASGIVSFPGIKAEQPIVRIRALSKEHDLAILELEYPIQGRSLVLANESSSIIGNKIYTCGNSLGVFQATFSDGIISGLRTINNTKFVQVTAPISPGNSGGPCLDENGQVLGVVSSTFRRGQNINMAVDISHVKQLLATKTDLIIYSSLFSNSSTKQINPQEVDEFIKISYSVYNPSNCSFTMRFKNISDQTIRINVVMVIWTDAQGETLDYQVIWPSSGYSCEILPKLTKESTTSSYVSCQPKGAAHFQIKILEMQ